MLVKPEEDLMDVYCKIFEKILGLFNKALCNIIL